MYYSVTAIETAGHYYNRRYEDQCNGIVGPEINTHLRPPESPTAHTGGEGPFCNCGWENETRSLPTTLYHTQSKMMKNLHVGAETLKSVRQTWRKLFVVATSKGFMKMNTTA